MSRITFNQSRSGEEQLHKAWDTSGQDLVAAVRNHITRTYSAALR